MSRGTDTADSRRARLGGFLRRHLRPLVLGLAALLMIGGIASTAHALSSTGPDPHAGQVATRAVLSAQASAASSSLDAAHRSLASAIGAPDPDRVARDSAAARAAAARRLAPAAVIRWRATVIGTDGTVWRYTATATTARGASLVAWSTDASGRVTGLTLTPASDPSAIPSPTSTPS